MKFLRRVILSILALVIVLIIFIFMHLQFSPRIGNAPNGDRLTALEASPHYRDGRFQNPVETDMSMPWRVMLKVIWQTLSGGEGREPQQPLPTRHFDRSAWALVPDTSFALAWFGHSTVLIKIDGKTILCDPVFSDRVSAVTFAGPKRFAYQNITQLEDLPPIDIVLLSHDHYDHLDYESILFLKDKVQDWLMPLGVGAHLEHWGVNADRIQEYDLWSGTSIGSIEMTLVPSRHFSGRGITDRFSTLWGSWVIKGASNKILFGGDSGYATHFAQIGHQHGPFDLVLLECGAYNENWSNIHMFPEEVPIAAKDLGASAVMPIHWGKFSLALHHWKDPIDRLSTAMNGSEMHLITPPIGQIMIDADARWSEQWWRDLK